MVFLRSVVIGFVLLVAIVSADVILPPRLMDTTSIVKSGSTKQYEDPYTSIKKSLAHFKRWCVSLIEAEKGK